MEVRDLVARLPLDHKFEGGERMSAGSTCDDQREQGDEQLKGKPKRIELSWIWVYPVYLYTCIFTDTNTSTC